MRKKEQKFFTRVMAWLLAFLMIVTLLPVDTLAAGRETDVISAVLEGQTEAAAEDTEGIFLKTTLTDNLTVKGRRKLFDVWARDSAGNKLTPTATLDGTELKPTWNDSVKTSFTLDFLNAEEGEHLVEITAADGDDTRSMSFHVIYKKAEPGEFIGYATVSIEAFTISKGYIVEPVLMPVFEGDNAAKAFVDLIREEGYDIQYTGSLDSGFYLSHIMGSNAKNPGNATKELDLTGAALEPHMLEKLPALADYFDPDEGTTGSLGEFDYGYMTGWMYCVNTVFPNVGFADYYLSDGDVMRAQFTVYYGGEIGGSSSMGGGWDDAYAVANKDDLTTTLARINSAPNSAELKKNPEIAAKIDAAKEVLQNIVADQAEVDKADSDLKALLSGEVTGLTLNHTELTLDNEESVLLDAQVDVTGTPTEPVVWLTDDPKVATVKNGKVTAVGAGTTTITVSCGEQSASCKVTVRENPMTGLELSESTLEILKNKSSVLKANILPSNTTDDRTVTWTSDNEEVATVSKDGKVTGKKEGTAVITAKAGSFEASCTVQVKEIHISRISFRNSSYTLNKGKNLSMSSALQVEPSDTTDSKTAVWSVEDPSVASISSTGYLRALAKGKTTVKAVIGGFEAVCELIVEEVPMTGVKVSAYTRSLKQGSSLYLSGSYLPSDTTDEKKGTWQSTDPSVATVSSSGKVQGVGLGDAVITFSCGEFSASCLVRVVDTATKNTTSLTTETSEVSMSLTSDSAARTLSVDTAGGTDPVIWKSADPSVATVDENGLLTAVGAGETVITVQSGNQTADIRVEVSEPISRTLSFELEPSDTVVTVKADDGVRVLPKDGVYTLEDGVSYTYTAARAGYIAEKGTIEASESGVRKITLQKAPENSLKQLPSAWKNFRNSDVNMAITQAKTPKSSASAYEKWSKKLGSGWTAAPSVQIIVDNALVVMSGTTIYKLDLETGDILKQGTMAASPSYGYTPPAYADGMIFAPLGGGIVQAFNAETLESLWIYRDEQGGQA